MAIWEFDNFSKQDLNKAITLVESLKLLGFDIVNPEAEDELTAELNRKHNSPYLHGSLTYRGLLGHLQVMDEEQLNSIVTIYSKDIDEYFPVQDINFVEETDVLDKNHPFLEIR